MGRSNILFHSTLQEGEITLDNKKINILIDEQTSIPDSDALNTMSSDNSSESHMRAIATEYFKHKKNMKSKKWDTRRNKSLLNFLHLKYPAPKKDQSLWVRLKPQNAQYRHLYMTQISISVGGLS